MQISERCLRGAAQPRGGALALAGLAGLLGSALGLALYAALVEPRRLEVRRSRVHIRSLPPAFEGLRVALLTDFHVGRTTPASTLRRAVRATLAETPHLIALAGDFVHRDPGDLHRALDGLRALSAPLGVFAVPGNHDRVRLGLPAWRRVLARHPRIHDLTNRHVLIHRGDATLCIAGVDDLEEGSPALRLPPPGDRDVTLLLAHNPDQAERSRRRLDQVDLVLSGHTHGGQIRIPFIGPVRTKSTTYDHGLRRRPWTQVYTSRGLGNTLLPIRFRARPELAVLELTAAPRPSWRGKRPLAGSEGWPYG